MEGVHSKQTLLNGHGHCLFWPHPRGPQGNRQRCPFFRPLKTTLKHALQNQIPIDYDDKIMIMMMIMVNLMRMMMTMTKNQTTTMIIWSK